MELNVIVFIRLYYYTIFNFRSPHNKRLVVTGNFKPWKVVNLLNNVRDSLGWWNIVSLL